MSGKPRRLWQGIIVSLVIAVLVMGSAVYAGEASEFLRIRRTEADEPVALEAAVVRYVADAEHADERGDVVVDLVSAVHLGEKSYYEELNRRFDKYDVVLYELVAPEGTRPPRGGGDRLNPIGMLQSGMKDMLGLELQLEQIDYERDHFVHADMSAEEFEQSMRARGDDFMAMFFRMLQRTLTEQAKNPRRGTNDLAMMMALLTGDNPLVLKRLLAEQFEDLESITALIEGPDGSTIISERNKVAFARLDEQLTAGKRRIAVFFGAGHMPDLEQRLTEQLGFTPLATTWLVAWDLQEPGE